MRTLIAALLLHGAALAQWTQQTIATDADFRGVAAVSERVAWVSGTKGTFGRTVDGGATWTAAVVPGAEKLDFRDVEAFSESTAYLLSIGPGELSRIYKTIDGGTSWSLQFKNADADHFYDAIAFWDETHGLAMSDPVNGQYRLLATDDGTTWKPLTPVTMPAALEKEGAFAASGTCLITRGDKDAWLVTGGGKVGRAFHSTDRGRTWTVQDTPIVAGTESAGIFSIAFRDADHGILVGGDYKTPKDAGGTAAVTADGGKTWKLIEKPLPFRSGVAWAKDRWIAVGTSGSHSSADGKDWSELDAENYNAVSFAKTGSGWAVGPKGRIARMGK